MDFKTSLVLVALAVGCSALPSQPKGDMSIFFEHVNPNSESRLVGGAEAPAGSHPHMAALTNGLWIRSFLCGGSIISARHVLTAAHCIDAVYTGALSSNLLVTVGTNRWNQGGQGYSIARNVTHPNWVFDIIKNDIGLLVTTRDIEFSALISPIALSFESVGAGVPAKVAGWGRIRGGGALSATLLELSTETVGAEECAEAVALASHQLDIEAPSVEPHIEICTFHSAGKGNCNGDSGSALVSTASGVQIGIVSWGFPCARGAPDMYARVSGFQNWIEENTK